MNNEKTKNVLLILLAVVALISVGYAAISTTLKIEGTSTISTSSWDVHFENLTITSGSVSATTPAAIQSDTTLVNYTVNLAKPGDYYEFTVDVKNTGSLNAKLSQLPTLGGVSTAQDVYTNYTVTYADGTSIGANDTLAVGATKSLKVRIEYDKSITTAQLPTEAQTLNLTFSMNFIQA